MEFEEIDLIRQSEKCTVQLVREKEEGRYFIRKILSGYHSVYLALQGSPHPYLPRLYDVTMADGSTTIIEEYIEGQTLDRKKLSEKQFLGVVGDLCSVLDFLHGMGIIHRDIKPSNIIYAEDGHIRLIDFDAARMPKDDLEQDTRLLGTRGFAPPEQYGFSQTDARADIYSLGATLEQILDGRAQKSRYKRIIRKCMDLNPDKRYQSVRQVKRVFFHKRRTALSVFMILILSMTVFCLGYGYIQKRQGSVPGSGESVPKQAASERYPNQILWRDIPIRGYLGRNMDEVMDEIMDEMSVPCDGNLDGFENTCVYMKEGIVFFYDEKRQVDYMAIDPFVSTYNGITLTLNKDKLIEIFGNPAFAGWKEGNPDDTEEIYYIDYYDIDTKEGFTFYLTSPEDEAYLIYID